MNRAWSVVVGVMLVGPVLVGCGPVKPPGGTVQFGFSVSDMVRNSANLKSPLNGIVYGNIFLQEDVSVTGPRSGAMEYADVQVSSVDLRTAATSEAKWTSPTLEAGKYVFLGFYDVNGNGATVNQPDPGDPVTLPTANRFEILDGQQVKRSVVFELVYN